jgi:hypothetical protein
MKSVLRRQVNNMATALHTFIDIFNTDFEVGGETVQLKRIVIPIIQRDYAQGRKDSDTERVRNRFLNSLYKAITEKPITLDFVYGDIDANGVMTPLDGQQRLTTLFLLHWYAAKKFGVVEKEYEFLKNFSYETRYSARDFCAYLIEFTPSFKDKISDEIIDQAWFPLDWQKDATISAMLVMLDSIDDKFREVDSLWESLSNKAVGFYFLPIKDMGLTDELYIKMNSRGKPLTGFEHFKAELERELKLIDETIAKRIMHKIDIEWTDMLWSYRGDNNVTDDEFLRYFRFICDIICYKAGTSSQGKGQNEFDLLDKYFACGSENAAENIALFESYFDVWCEVSKECTPTAFLARYISTEHEDGKIKFENKPDIFGDCLQSYADVYGNGNRSFPLNRIILLYAIVVYLENRNSVSEEEFIRRIRVVHNLVRNSEDEISDSESRSAGNRMPAILRQVDSIIIKGTINDFEENNFNSFRLEEEKEKLNWVEENASLAADLFKLEDNRVLRGQISIVGLDNYHNFDKFIQLFDCEWDLIDCALMATGDYKQCERNGWRQQLGSRGSEKSWINLFHKSANRGYQNTKDVLKELLEAIDVINDDTLSEYIQAFIEKCESDNEYSWRYYYIKYKEFRPGRYGKYSWRDLENGYYDMHALWTESQWSENSYQPFLYVAKPEIISRDDLGHYSIWKDMRIECANTGYIFRELEEEKEVFRIDIRQTEDGIDKEDRIIKLRKYLETGE